MEFNYWERARFSTRPRRTVPNAPKSRAARYNFFVLGHGFRFGEARRLRLFRLQLEECFRQKDRPFLRQGFRKIFERRNRQGTKRYIAEGISRAIKRVVRTRPRHHSRFGKFLQDAESFIGLDQLPERRNPARGAWRARPAAFGKVAFPYRKPVCGVKQYRLGWRR